MAARLLGASPVSIVVDREIRRDEVKLRAVVGTQNVGVAHAFLAQMAHEHGLLPFSAVRFARPD